MSLSLSIPRFFYGTAWKEDRTTDLTFQALKSGFAAIDTANQRKHYYEEAVGLGLQKFLELKTKKREDLFLQTKFTYIQGQDHRLPYNKNDSFRQQVADSFASSLQHLNTDFIDSYILHGPYNHQGISGEDLECWSAMEELVASKQVRHLGISNVSAEQLAALCRHVRIQPHFVQNRCFANQAWDQGVRAVCQRHKIFYQGFSLLTANRNEVNSSLVTGLAKKYNKDQTQVIFRFCQQLGMICLTGTSDPQHMKSDLDIADFDLSVGEIEQIEAMAVVF